MWKLSCSAKQVQEAPRFIPTLEEAQSTMTKLADIAIKVWQDELTPVTSDNEIQLLTTDGRLQCKLSVEEVF